MKKRLIGISIFFVIGLVFVLFITSPKDNKRIYTSFSNIKGEGIIDDKNPNYWDNKNFVYFKLYDYYYIAKFNEKKNKVEDYISLYHLNKKEYKDYDYLIGTPSYLYLIGNNKLGIYDLIVDNKIIKNISNIEILGVKDKIIYTKENNNYYKYNAEFKHKEKTNKIPSKINRKKIINK